jgi:hypothetical protein
MRNLTLGTATVVVGVFLAGCASIIHGTRQDVGISSSPTGATVTIDNGPAGVTPLIADLRRKDNHIVRIEMEGFQPFETTITRSVSGWVWGNLVFGAIPGLAIDAITGGLYKLSPENVSGTLAEEELGLELSGDKLYVTVVLRPDPTWARLGNLRESEGTK